MRCKNLNSARGLSHDGDRRRRGPAVRCRASEELVEREDSGALDIPKITSHLLRRDDLLERDESGALDLEKLVSHFMRREEELMARG